MLELVDLHAGYGRVEAVHGVSLSVSRGSCVGIIGSNGAGKSTTLNTISGLIRATSGDVRFGGQSIRRRAPHRIASHGLVQIPEGRRILPQLTVEENLGVSTGPNCPRRTRDARVRSVFELFPVLAEKRHQSGGSLSGGQQQMLAIGRALMGRPLVIMLDEPSLGLAPVIVDQVFAALEHLRGAGVTILMVEQNAARALSFVDYCYVMERGHIVAEGASDALRRDSQVLSHYLAVNDAPPGGVAGDARG